MTPTSPSGGKTSTSTSSSSRLSPHGATASLAAPLAHQAKSEACSAEPVHVRPALKLPSACNKKAWSVLDSPLDVHIREHFPTHRLESEPPSKLLSDLEDLLHWFFDHQASSSAPKPPPRSRRIKSVETLRRRRRDLKREFRRRRARGDDLTDIKAEYFAIGKQIRRICKQQRQHEERLQRQRNQRDFLRDPYKYGRRLFKPRSSVKPSFDSSACHDYFCRTYADADRSSTYDNCPVVPPAPDAENPVSATPPSWSEFRAVLKRCRNGSAPGPNRIPYVVWKFCPSLHPVLYTIIRRVWIDAAVPSSWQRASIILLAKSNITDDPTKFRPIALANTDGKIFFSLLARRITNHMSGNNYMDGVSQKGFLPGVSGCIEHSTLLYEAMLDARRAKRQICVAWVDLKNAFGSIRHNLIQFALHHYHLPVHLQQLVFAYYSSLSAFVSEPATDPFQYNIGVFQGCPLSPILFNVCFQLLLDALSEPSVLSLSYDFKDGPISVSNTAFADDLGLLSKSSNGCQKMLNVTDSFLTWSRCMKAAPRSAEAVRVSSLTESTRATIRPWCFLVSQFPP